VAVAKGFGIQDAFSTSRMEGSDSMAQRIQARTGTTFCAGLCRRR
jgi:sulfur transfer protein SufE